MALRFTTNLHFSHFSVEVIAVTTAVAVKVILAMFTTNLHYPNWHYLN
jgi:hypothetical protein